MPGGGPEVFSAAATRWSKFEDRSGPTLANLFSIARTVTESTALSDADKRKHLKMLQNSIHQVVQMEAEAMKRREACQAISLAQMREHQHQEPIEDFHALFEKSMEQGDRAAARVDVKRASHSRQIGEMIAALDGNGDEDITVQPTGVSITTKCPILSTDMKHPMKNELCGHVYSLEGALMLLQQKHGSKVTFRKLDDVPETPKCRCPVAGCPRVFGPKTLKRDFSTELTQRQMQNMSSDQTAVDAEAVEMLD